MSVWKCKQGVDFDKSTITVKEERNRTVHQTKLSIIIFSFSYIGTQLDLTQVMTLKKKIWSSTSELKRTKKEQCLRWFVKLWKVTDSFAEQCM